MQEDIKTVIEKCAIIDGRISCTIEELETIYELGYISGRIVERKAVLEELNAICM